MNLQDLINLKATALAEAQAAENAEALEAVRIAYLGRKGKLPEIMQELAQRISRGTPAVRQDRERAEERAGRHYQGEAGRFCRRRFSIRRFRPVPAGPMAKPWHPPPHYPDHRPYYPDLSNVGIHRC